MKNILVVDLDGTLLKSDMLLEAITERLTRNPLNFFVIMWNIFLGRVKLKEYLAKTARVDVKTLPFNKTLVQWLNEQKKCGRFIVLATATHFDFASKISDHLGLFDKVIATNNTTNLKGPEKKQALVNLYGVGGYDYVGNDKADICVWETASEKYLVSTDNGFAKKIQAKIAFTKIFLEEGPSLLSRILKAIRIHQWAKNTLVFIPFVLAYPLVESNALSIEILAFILFSLTASSVYILNDLLDLPHDRLHYRKQSRVFASGNLSLLVAWSLWPSLLFVSVYVAIHLMNIKFVIIMICYYVLTTAYSFKLKQIEIVDVLVLALLYTMRIIAGAVAVNLPLSFWLLGFSLFIFLSLALVKRFCELYVARKKINDGNIKGRGYIHQDLELVSTMGIASGYISVMVLGLYIDNQAADQFYTSPHYIWFICPLLLFWISRIWLIAHRGALHDDPVFFALKDRVSWFVFILLSLIFYFAKHI